MDHAPREYCKWAFGDPDGKNVAWCRLQRETNSNWYNLHLPDIVDAWPGDFFKAAAATQQLLSTLLKSESKLLCRCGRTKK